MSIQSWTQLWNQNKKKRKTKKKEEKEEEESVNHLWRQVEDIPVEDDDFMQRNQPIFDFMAASALSGMAAVVACKYDPKYNGLFAVTFAFFNGGIFSNLDIKLKMQNRHCLSYVWSAITGTYVGIVGAHLLYYKSD